MMYITRWTCTAVLPSRRMEILPGESIVTEVHRDYVPEDFFGDYDDEYKMAVYSKLGLCLIPRESVTRYW